MWINVFFTFLFHICLILSASYFTFVSSCLLPTSHLSHPVSFLFHICFILSASYFTFVSSCLLPTSHLSHPVCFLFHICLILSASYFTFVSFYLLPILHLSHPVCFLFHICLILSAHLSHPIEVRLDGWCEGGLRLHRNEGVGCETMCERSERVESPGTYVTEWVSRGHFCLALCSFGPPSCALVVITWREEGCRYMMWLG